jgi:hypothetical protein
MVNGIRQGSYIGVTKVNKALIGASSSKLTISRKERQGYIAMDSLYFQIASCIKVGHGSVNEHRVVNASNRMKVRIVLNTNHIRKWSRKVQDEVSGDIGATCGNQTNIKVVNRDLHNIVRQWHGVVQHTRGRGIHCGLHVI